MGFTRLVPVSKSGILDSILSKTTIESVKMSKKKLPKKAAFFKINIIKK
jgi:hypothetical protein